MTESSKIEKLKLMKVGEEILVNDQKRILLHFNEEKKIAYVKDINSIDGASIKVELGEIAFLEKNEKGFFFQKYLTLSASLSLSSVSAFMTIVGFMNFFFLNKLVIGFLFGAIELVKFVSATIIFNNTNISKKHKVGLFLFLSILITISTIGHYSYLSQSFFSNKETANIKVERINEEKNMLLSNISDLEKENTRLENEVNLLPENRKTQRRELTFKNNKKIKENINKIAENREKLIELSETLEKEKSISVDKSASTNTLKAFGSDSDKYASFLIFLLSLIIDPLAFYFAYLFGNLKRKN